MKSFTDEYADMFHPSNVTFIDVKDHSLKGRLEKKWQKFTKIFTIGLIVSIVSLVLAVLNF